MNVFGPLEKAGFEIFGTDPDPFPGRTYYNSTAKEVRVYDSGDAAWRKVVVGRVEIDLDTVPADGDFLVYDSGAGIWAVTTLNFPQDLPLIDGGDVTKYLGNNGTLPLWRDIHEQPLQGDLDFNAFSVANVNLVDGIDVSAIALTQSDHLNGGASKHDGSEIDYERSDGSKVDILAASDDIESAITDLDDNKLSCDGLNTASQIVIDAGGSIDTGAAGELNIGGVTATTINLGRTSQRVVVKGDFEVQGTETIFNTATLEVEDAQITINKGGNAALAASEKAGVRVEMTDATDVKVHYDSTVASKWKAGEVAATHEILTTGHNQTIDSVKTFESEVVYTDILATPTNPASGSKKFYNLDGILYTLDSDGNEVEVGSGSGGGSINLIDNSSGTNGVSGYTVSGTGLTVSQTKVTAEIPLHPKFKAAIKLVNAGSGTGHIAYKFRVPPSLKDRSLNLEWHQLVGSAYVSGDYKLELYWNSASDYSGAYTEVSLDSDNESDDTLIIDTTRLFQTRFMVAGNDYYELRFYRVAGILDANSFISINELSVNVQLKSGAGGIVDADVNVFAAISGSKIVAATGSVAGVVTTEAQTIAGAKTFSSTITGDISGNAGMVTNGVYTSGDQTIAGAKTFSSTIVGSIDGNAGTVTDGVYLSGDQTITGAKTFSSTGRIFAHWGSAAAPGYSFNNDSDTGIYSSGANQVAVATSGTVRRTIRTDYETATLPQRGQNGTAAAPSYAFSSDANTGMFRIGADNLGFSAGGLEVMSISSGNNVGIGIPGFGASSMLDVGGNSIRIRTSYTPATASSTGQAGTIAWDTNYLYICVGTNSWKRVAISTW